MPGNEAEAATLLDAYLESCEDQMSVVADRRVQPAVSVP